MHKYDFLGNSIFLLLKSIEKNKICILNIIILFLKIVAFQSFERNQIGSFIFVSRSEIT